LADANVHRTDALSHVNVSQLMEFSRWRHSCSSGHVRQNHVSDQVTATLHCHRSLKHLSSSSVTAAAAFVYSSPECRFRISALAANHFIDDVFGVTIIPL